MVFRKLSAEDKTQIAAFATEINPSLIPAVRALTMRGCTPDEAKTKVLERGADEPKPKQKRKQKGETVDITATEFEEQVKPKPKAKSKAKAAAEVEEQVKPKSKAKPVATEVEKQDKPKPKATTKVKKRTIEDTAEDEADAVIKF